jgi:hypothetical protein
MYALDDETAKETSMEGHSDIRSITVPYDSGHQDRRMGAGPQHLLDNGLAESLQPEGAREVDRHLAPFRFFLRFRRCIL